MLTHHERSRLQFRFEFAARSAATDLSLHDHCRQYCLCTLGDLSHLEFVRLCQKVQFVHGFDDYTTDTSGELIVHGCRVYHIPLKVLLSRGIIITKPGMDALLGRLNQDFQCAYGAIHGCPIVTFPAWQRLQSGFVVSSPLCRLFEMAPTII